MLTHPMRDQLGQLGLSGMAQAFAELEASDETATLTHADWPWSPFCNSRQLDMVSITYFTSRVRKIGK